MNATVFRQSYMTQRPSLFVYTDQLLCHCVFICSKVRWRLAYCMRWLLWCFCLLAESYETINHYHYCFEAGLDMSHHPSGFRGKRTHDFFHTCSVTRQI